MDSGHSATAPPAHFSGAQKLLPNLLRIRVTVAAESWLRGRVSATPDATLAELRQVLGNELGDRDQPVALGAGARSDATAA
jgi:hypothetical protein